MTTLRMGDWMELSGLGARRHKRGFGWQWGSQRPWAHRQPRVAPGSIMGLGAVSEEEELAQVQARRAEVQAEIARLKAGGSPAPGGYVATGAAFAAPTPMPLSPPAPTWPKIVAGVAVVGVGAVLLSKVLKGRRRSR